MWIVIKFEKKNLASLKYDFKKKMGEEVQFYIPKIKLQIIKKNKFCNKINLVLNNYLFCFHKNFKNNNSLNIIKYSKGLKSLLPGFLETQKEIVDFINRCKKYEDKNGFLSNSFFDLIKNYYNKNYKFQSGPFTNMIFNIINSNKNTLDILIENKKITVENKKYLFKTV